jgi:polyamine oxidase
MIEVIVIGAGVAGLAAARALHDAGSQVVVLEGRDRPGGRISTDRSLGTPVDLGAAWIHGIRGNPITALARRAGVRTLLSPHEALRLWDADGGMLSLEAGLATLRGFRELLEDAAALGARIEQDISMAEALARLSPERADAQRVLAWSQGWLELMSGGACEALSLQHWSDDQELPGPDHVVPHGYDGIVQHLARGLDIRFEHEVEHIDWSGDEVVVDTSCGAFRAARVVITLPLGVLKAGDVAFTPALPERKRAAIERLGVGTVDKIALRFQAPFWPRDATHLHLMSATRDEIRGFTSLWPQGAPVLVAYACGRSGHALEALDDDGAVAPVLDALARMFGAAVTPVEGALVSRWRRDPFSRGASSYIPVGASGEDYDAMATPVGDRLYFAGEATFRKHPSTVHGAYLSGLREAGRLLAGRFLAARFLAARS